MRAGTRSGNAARGIRVPPSLLPLPREGDELSRLWSSEHAQLPCPESLARSKARRSRRVSQHDRGGYTLVSRNGSSDQPPSRVAAHYAGIERNNVPLRAARSSGEAATIRD